MSDELLAAPDSAEIPGCFVKNLVSPGRSHFGSKVPVARRGDYPAGDQIRFLDGARSRYVVHTADRSIFLGLQDLDLTQVLWTGNQAIDIKLVSQRYS